MSKTVLVTGSAGFIGSHLTRFLLHETDWNIIGLDSFRHRGDQLRISDDVDMDRYKMYTCDLTAPLGRLADTIGHVDYILNVASMSHVDTSIVDPVNFVRNNVDIVLNMLEFARFSEPEMFLQFSTDEVYGPARKDQLHKEWSTIIPSNPYSGSKAAQEAIAISYWRTYGVPLVITNTMNVVGPQQEPEKFVPALIKAFDRQTKPTIHVDENLKPGARFYIDVRDVASAMKFICENVVPVKYNEDAADVPLRYNVVGEQEIDNITMAEMVFKEIYPNVPFDEGRYEAVNFHSVRPGHDRRYALDGTALANVGWTPQISIEDTIKSLISWYRNNDIWLYESMEKVEQI